MTPQGLHWWSLHFLKSWHPGSVTFCLTGRNAQFSHINCGGMQLDKCHGDECQAEGWFATSGDFDLPVLNMFFMVLSPKSLMKLAESHLCVSLPTLPSFPYWVPSHTVDTQYMFSEWKFLECDKVPLLSWFSKCCFTQTPIRSHCPLKRLILPRGSKRMECVSVDVMTTVWWVWLCVCVPKHSFFIPGLWEVPSI